MGSPPSLTERDHELLVSLFKYRYLSTPQVQRLHFPSAQTALRRLRRLSAHGYITTFKSTACPDRIATLSRRGAETVAEQLSLSANDLGWAGHRQQPKDYLFLQHFLAASDFRITLTKACAEHSSVELLGFIPEHHVKPTSAGAIQRYIRDVITDTTDPRQKLTHAPDAVFALAHAGQPALFFLEIDRGTEVLSNPDRGFLKMLRFYLTYLRDGGYQRYRDDFGVAEPLKGFRALVVTSSQTRLRNIREVARRLRFDPPQARRFVWLGTLDTLSDPALLSREWVPLDPDDERRYSIAPDSRYSS